MALYAKYVSAFKGKEQALPEFGFSDSKLVPLLESWVRRIPRTAPCLDLGCGHGNILHALKTMGFTNVQGVDISEEQVAIARRLFPGTECTGVFEKLESTAPASLHLVTLFDVLEHLTKPEILRLLELIHSRLVPGGMLIVHCPNGDSPFVGAIQHGDFTQTILTTQSAQNICTLAGFQAFAAREHLGASPSVAGCLRLAAWQMIRLFLSAYHAVETGGRGAGIWTRNFCFKAEKAPVAPTR